MRDHDRVARVDLNGPSGQDQQARSVSTVDAKRAARHRSRGEAKAHAFTEASINVVAGRGVQVCSGESMAILGADGPGDTADTLPDFLNRHDVRLLWHPSLSPETPSELAGIKRVVTGRQTPHAAVR
jgi:hypothetical protein